MAGLKACQPWEIVFVVVLISEDLSLKQALHRYNDSKL